MLNRVIASILLTIVLFISGCSVPEYESDIRYIYRVRQFRPDGDIHRKWIIKSDKYVEVLITNEGLTYIDAYLNETLTPIGWKLEAICIDSEFAEPKSSIRDDRSW